MAGGMHSSSPFQSELGDFLWWWIRIAWCFIPQWCCLFYEPSHHISEHDWFIYSSPWTSSKYFPFLKGVKILHSVAIGSVLTLLPCILEQEPPRTTHRLSTIKPMVDWLTLPPFLRTDALWSPQVLASPSSIGFLPSSSWCWKSVFIRALFTSHFH